MNLKMLLLIQIQILIIQIMFCKGEFIVHSHKNGFGNHKLIFGQKIDDNSTNLIKDTNLSSGCRYKC